MDQAAYVKKMEQNIKAVRRVIYISLAFSFFFSVIFTALSYYEQQGLKDAEINYEYFLFPGFFLLLIFLITFVSKFLYKRWPWQKIGAWWPCYSEEEYDKCMFDLE